MMRLFACPECGCLQIAPFPSRPSACHCGATRLLWVQAVEAQRRAPSVRLNNVHISQCGTAVAMGPGTHGAFEDVTVEDCPVAFDMGDGASGDFTNVRHTFTQPVRKERRTLRRRPR